QEARNFKIFEKRIGVEKFEKKMLKLYDYLRSGKYGEHDDILVEKLYPPKNKNAYYRLKNRLINNLQKSLIEFHLNVDKRMNVLSTIMLARIFYYKANYKLSYSYLEKAEKQAVESASFNLLNLIYDEIINLSKYYYEINPEHYIKLKQERNEEYARIQQVDYMLASINYKLHKGNFSERNGDLIQELEAIQKQFDLLPENQSEAVKVDVHRCVRNILLQKRDFNNLEMYLKKSYTQFQEEGFFNRSNHREKIILLTWVINTLNKNTRFEESLERLGELKEALEDYNKLYFDQYIWTYYQALITNYSSSSQNEKAIELLETLKRENADKQDFFYTSFIYIELVSLYFNLENFQKSTQNLNHLLHTSLYQSLPATLKMGLSIAEIILRIEMDDLNYAYSRLKALKRSLRTMLNKEEYQQEKAFVSILGAILGEPDAFKQDKVRKKIRQFLEGATFELGAENVVDYVAWLQAKMNNRPYYELLLEMNQASPEKAEA
ncbi:MAG: hypothetical protein AAGI38_16510, partial [Bacteroidota bacterium]